MKKRILSSFMVAAAYGLVLALTLIACGPGSGPASSVSSSGGSASVSSPGGEASASSSTGDPSSSRPLPGISSSAGKPSDQPAGSAALGGSASVSSSGDSSAGKPAAPTPQEQGSAMAKAYRKALEGIYHDHIYPNGDPLETFEMESNDFAIFDVDGDGDLELIYQNDSSITAGMSTNIYSFEPDSGKLYLELSGFCGMTFYDNGMIDIPASHNHGLSQLEDFWPYALYQYDIGGDGYLMMGSVDAWDKALFPQGYDGEPFPDDIDQDGDGVVYLITFSGPEVTATPMDSSDYLRWRNAFIDGAAELTIPWQAMTKENIQAVSP